MYFSSWENEPNYVIQISPANFVQICPTFESSLDDVCLQDAIKIEESD